MPQRSRQSVLGLAFVILGLSTAACSGSGGGGEKVTLNEATYLQTSAGRVSAGSGCMSALLPAGTAEAPPGVDSHAGDFNHSESTDGDAFLVQVFSDSELLATRRYDAVTLQSGRVDEFAVVTHSGAKYTLRYWGGSCAGADVSQH
jgi:hypothetical protein